MRICLQIYKRNIDSAKDEGLGACAQTRVRRRIFFAFLPYSEVPSHEDSHKKYQPQKIPLFFFALMRCLVKFVVLQSHSQSICVPNQCHITINTHLLSHNETCSFPSNFLPKRNLLHCCFCFHSTDLQQYN